MSLDQIRRLLDRDLDFFRRCPFDVDLKPIHHAVELVCRGGSQGTRSGRIGRADQDQGVLCRDDFLKHDPQLGCIDKQLARLTGHLADQRQAERRRARSAVEHARGDAGTSRVDLGDQIFEGVVRVERDLERDAPVDDLGRSAVNIDFNSRPSQLQSGGGRTRADVRDFQITRTTCRIEQQDSVPGIIDTSYNTNGEGIDGVNDVANILGLKDGQVNGTDLPIGIRNEERALANACAAVQRR